MYNEVSNTAHRMMIFIKLMSQPIEEKYYFYFNCFVATSLRKIKTEKQGRRDIVQDDEISSNCCG